MSYLYNYCLYIKGCMLIFIVVMSLVVFVASCMFFVIVLYVCFLYCVYCVFCCCIVYIFVMSIVLYRALLKTSLN